MNAVAIAGRMFGRLLQSLLALPPAPLAPDAAHLALAALLVRVARADDAYDGDEVLRIERVLMSDYGLSPSDAAHLREEAEALEAEAPDTVRFTRALKEAVALDDRIGLIEALWSVAASDGSTDADEEAQIRLIANLLGISDRDRALARQRSVRA